MPPPSSTVQSVMGILSELRQDVDRAMERWRSNSLEDGDARAIYTGGLTKLLELKRLATELDSEKDTLIAKSKESTEKLLRNHLFDKEEMRFVRKEIQHSRSLDLRQEVKELISEDDYRAKTSGQELQSEILISHRMAFEIQERETLRRDLEKLKKRKKKEASQLKHSQSRMYEAKKRLKSILRKTDPEIAPMFNKKEVTPKQHKTDGEKETSQLDTNIPSHMPSNAAVLSAPLFILCSSAAKIKEGDTEGKVTIASIEVQCDNEEKSQVPKEKDLLKEHPCEDCGPENLLVSDPASLVLTLRVDSKPITLKFRYHPKIKVATVTIPEGSMHIKTCWELLDTLWPEDNGNTLLENIWRTLSPKLEKQATRWNEKIGAYEWVQSICGLSVQQNTGNVTNNETCSIFLKEVLDKMSQKA